MFQLVHFKKKNNIFENFYDTRSQNYTKNLLSCCWEMCVLEVAWMDFAYIYFAYWMSCNYINIVF